MDAGADPVPGIDRDLEGLALVGAGRLPGEYGGPVLPGLERDAPREGPRSDSFAAGKPDVRIVNVWRLPAEKLARRADVKAGG